MPSNPRIGPPVHSQFGKSVYFQLLYNRAIVSEYTFPINPEEFNFSRPERVRVVQTLGFPFVDEYGLGLPTINMRGTTGWHLRSSIGMDGYEAYKALRQDIHDRFYTLRAEKLELGIDPDTIQLRLYNNVDDSAFIVVPTEFRLLRSKSRPLLYQYDLNFIVIRDLTKYWRDTSEADTLVDWLKALLDGRIDILDEAINALYEIAPGLKNLVDATKKFIQTARAVLTIAGRTSAIVAKALRDIAQFGDDALNLVRDSQAFINDLGLPIVNAVNTLITVYNEIKCYLSKGIKEHWLPDFSGIYGTTDCAATRGVASGFKTMEPASSALDWIVGLQEAAKNTDVANAVSFVSPEDKLLSRNTTAPLLIDESFTSEGDKLTGKVASIDSKSKALNALNDLGDILNLVEANPHYENTESEEITENLQKIENVKTVKVKADDTLEEIALRELGDASKWRDIAALNRIVIASPLTILVPKLDITINVVSVAAGQTFIDLPSPVADLYAGDRARIKGASGKSLWFTVKSVSDNVLGFDETFSEAMTGPLTLTRFVNVASYGLYDYTTHLSQPFSTGEKTMYLDEVKDIYAGYALNLRTSTQTRSFTVLQVNYFERTVLLTETNTFDFEAGAQVEIYDTESRLHRLEEGLDLYLPMNIVSDQTSRDVFGADIRLDKNGHLDVGEAGDFVTVEGYENLKQAIEHRVVTPYGSLVYHPNYGSGLPAMIGEKNRSVGMGMARAALFESLSREPRINGITESCVEVSGDKIVIEVTVIPVEEKTPLDLNLVL
jgi:phage baseplate assembly protein W/LysM repeat protein